MRSSVVQAVRNTLLALAVGAFLPSIGSACSVSPGSGNDSAFAPGTMASLMPSPSSESAVPFEKDSKWDHKWNHHKDRHWGDQDADDDDDSSTSSTVASNGTSDVGPSDDPPPTTSTGDSPTSTPEPGTLALLALGAMAVGLGLSNRRTKPAEV